MTLDKWCSKNGWSYADIMRQAEVSYTAVMRGCKGELSRYRTAKAIENITDGEVTVDTLCSENAP